VGVVEEIIKVGNSSIKINAEGINISAPVIKLESGLTLSK